MILKLNEILSTEMNPDIKNWELLTKGIYPTGLNLFKACLIS
jgi:hypothetical protein